MKQCEVVSILQDRYDRDYLQTHNFALLIICFFSNIDIWIRIYRYIGNRTANKSRFFRPSSKVRYTRRSIFVSLYVNIYSPCTSSFNRSFFTRASDNIKKGVQVLAPIFIGSRTVGSRWLCIF